ncbi:hypothetical protein ACWJKU_13550 [Methylocaldum sp. MU1018]
MASSFRRFSHFCAQMHSPLFTPPQVPLMAPRPNMTPIAIKKITAAITAKVIRNSVMIRLASINFDDFKASRPIAACVRQPKTAHPKIAADFTTFSKKEKREAS